MVGRRNMGFHLRHAALLRSERQEMQLSIEIIDGHGDAGRWGRLHDGQCKLRSWVWLV
jgi:hypothetical protein